MDLDLVALLGMLLIAGSLYFAWNRFQEDKKIASISDEKEKQKAQSASRMSWLNIVLAMIVGGALIWLGYAQEGMYGYGYAQPVQQFYRPYQKKVYRYLRPQKA